MSVYDPKCYYAVTQDRGASRQGTLLADSENSDNMYLDLPVDFVKISNVGWQHVKWDNGQENIYRMGAEDCYDLQLSTGNFYDV